MTADAARLRITLLDLKPAPWREIEVPLSMSLHGLHDSLQAAFLWQHAHLYEFRIGDKHYGIPDPDFAGMGGPKVYKASVARLRDVLKPGMKPFTYVYDFGDDWHHRVVVKELFEAPPDVLLPRFIGGKWRTPPEDIGGPPGYEIFLDALNDPNHPDRAMYAMLIEDGIDLADIDRDIVEIELDRMARARIRRRKS